MIAFVTHVYTYMYYYIITSPFTTTVTHVYTTMMSATPIIISFSSF